MAGASAEVAVAASDPRGQARRPWLGLLAGMILAAGCSQPDDRARVVGGALSEGFLNAMRLAVEDALVEGPIPGLDTVLVEAVSNRATPAIKAADSLVAIPGLVAVVGHSNSAASLATAPIYNGAGVVQLAPTSTAPVYSQAGPLSFRMVPPDDTQGAFLADVVEGRFEEARLAIMFVNDEYGRGLRAAFLQNLDGARFQVVVDLPHNEEDVQEPDTDGLLATLSTADPDMLVWLGRVPVLNGLLPGLRQELGELPILAGDAVYWADLLDDRIPEWAGVEYLDFVDMDGSPALRDFSERMWARFGEQPGGAEALTYDATRVILEALRAGARSGTEVRAYLESLGHRRPAFEGLAGSLTFDADGDAERTYVLRRMGADALTPSAR